MWLYLLKYWKVGALVALLLVISGLYAYNAKLHSDLADANAQLTVIKKDFQVSQANLKHVSDALEAQNAAIDRLKRDAEERAARNAKEIAKAQAIANGFKEMANGLLRQPPDPTLSLCDNANVQINKEIQRVRK